MQKKSNQMDRGVFKNNLLTALKEIPLFNENIEGKTLMFIISIDKELGKNHNSDDDIMRLGTLLFSEGIENKEFELDRTVDMLNFTGIRFPLWAEVSLYEIKGDSIIIKIRTSSRFRKPSELFYKETGHPPFKVAISENWNYENVIKFDTP